MDNTKIESLITECKRIQEDSTYTAEVHHIIAHKLSKKAYWYKLIPVSITVLSAFALLFGAPNWVSWITLLSGTITILNVFIEPEKKSRDHLFAAKNFTSLKHEARSLHESFKGFMSESEFYYSVKLLRDKYNLVVQCTPLTDDEKAWEKARERIKKGVHESDFKSEVK